MYVNEKRIKRRTKFAPIYSPKIIRADNAMHALTNTNGKDHGQIEAMAGWRKQKREMQTRKQRQRERNEKAREGEKQNRNKYDRKHRMGTKRCSSLSFYLPYMCLLMLKCILILYAFCCWYSHNKHRVHIQYSTLAKYVCITIGTKPRSKH